MGVPIVLSYQSRNPFGKPYLQYSQRNVSVIVFRANNICLLGKISHLGQPEGKSAVLRYYHYHNNGILHLLNPSSG